MPRERRHRVVVLAFDGVVLGDLAVPCELFSRARRGDDTPAYEVLICAERRLITSRHLRLEVGHTLRALHGADTVVIPGLEEGAALPTRVVHALTRLLSTARRPPRVMSICTGAFVLAATGALDGHRATTHWRACAALKEAFPKVEVDPDVLFVDLGRVLTSAGASAGLDLCLHVVRSDLGATQAARVAREAVVALERTGGQAQFIEREVPPADESSLSELATWAARHLAQDLSLAALARQAAISVRTLTRRVHEQLGTSPAAWVAVMRVRRAQQLLERTSLPVERIAEEVGFGSSAALRERFQQVARVSPSQWRRNFGSTSPMRFSGGKRPTRSASGTRRARP